MRRQQEALPHARSLLASAGLGSRAGRCSNSQLGPTDAMQKPPPAEAAAHILIAEDSAVQAYMLSHLLQERGYRVSIATNGGLALSLASEIRPSLIVSDVNMPELSGYELCRRIKANPALADTPVILVTNLADPNDVLLGLKSGADSFVIKPYQKAHMLARVEHALLNREAEARDAWNQEGAVELFFNGQKHYINASRKRILNLLMSTYDATLQRNQELQESRELLAERTIEAMAANRFLDSIIENIPDMIFIKDAADLKFVRFNRAGEELLGYSREQMLGKCDADFFPKDESDHFAANDREVLASGGRLEIAEEPVQTAENGIRLLRTKKVAVLDEDGVATHLLGISEDVTEQKQLASEIQALNSALKTHTAHLEESNKSLESFTSAATHDLRSPLRTIDGFAGLLEKHYASQLDEKGQRYLSVIRATAKNMGKLIDDLLAFSRMGQKELSSSAVDMQALVEQVLEEMLQLDPAGRRASISIAPLPAAHGDEPLLRQVWVNLLSNAIKYSRHTDQPKIEISGQQEGRETTYQVRDNGTGFSMDFYDKLFQIFERLPTEQVFEGTGVGLPIVQRIVTRHGGRVWAKGKVGEGAVFYFSLPLP